MEVQMAHGQGTQLRDLLATLIHETLDESLAKALGVVERERKVDIVIFVWSLILGFPTGAKRTLSALRRSFEQASGQRMASSSFYNRFTPQMTKLLEKLVEHVLAVRSGPANSYQGRMIQGFEKLLALDSTVVRLHDMLQTVYPACPDGQSALKLHVVMNVLSGSPGRVKLSDGTTHDQGVWTRVGSWVKGCLLLFDLGYCNFHPFHRIDRQGGFFVSRMKSNANPLIVENLTTCAGRSIDLVGQKLQDVVGRLRRRVIDVEVELPVKLRRYRGKQRQITRRFRMIGIRNDNTGEYHFYVTNVGQERLSAEDVGHIYALRWQVELLFRRLRSHGRLHQLPTQQEHIVKALIWASILAVLVSQKLLWAMRLRDRGRHLPALRFQEVFESYARAILEEMVAHRRTSKLDLFDLIYHEAVDPNLDRVRSFDILDAA
ncbi:IS4 family transposase [Persicimonas caeni]|uniref:IS4 family transposase n=2 Tax=Persicimonas caeni TaxID=2292766 RepID=A0A4Y6PNC2_PERCE|nr:IS4 family transposase [Persicimonas caeni]QED31005.1 IS4 family transposase [Persicimonas caeni]